MLKASSAPNISSRIRRGTPTGAIAPSAGGPRRAGLRCCRAAFRAAIDAGLGRRCLEARSVWQAPHFLGRHGEAVEALEALTAEGTRLISARAYYFLKSCRAGLYRPVHRGVQILGRWPSDHALAPTPGTNWASCTWPPTIPRAPRLPFRRANGWATPSCGQKAASRGGNLRQAGPAGRRARGWPSLKQSSRRVPTARAVYGPRGPFTARVTRWGARRSGRVVGGARRLRSAPECCTCAATRCSSRPLRRALAVYWRCAVDPTSSSWSWRSIKAAWATGPGCAASAQREIAAS